MIEGTGTVTRRAIVGGAATALAVGGGRRRAAAQSPGIRIGYLTDMSGPYSDINGPNGAVCARQAIEEFASHGITAEVLIADHQNKADVGLSIVRAWFDQGGVDVIMDVGNSAIALAVASLVSDRNKVQLNTAAGSSVLTGTACNANLIHWTYDTWCSAHTVVGSIMQAGSDRWFFITADYAFGKGLQADASRFVEAGGGKVVGSSVYPFPGNSDFSAYLLKAQSSGANVVAFCNGGADLRNCVKQAAEFGVEASGIRPAALVGFIQDVKALGLKTAEGLTIMETFYWDLNDRTRAFTQRVKPKLPSDNPLNMLHAGAYSSTLHYLKAVNAMGLAQAKADGRATVAAMKSIPTDDDCFGPGKIRIDGRKIHPSYLFRAKRPEESKGSWDLMTLVGTTPADEAFRPLNEGGCPLVPS